MPVIIQLRRGTAAEWTAADPTLAEGELGLETDTPAFKVGDGTTAWTSLPYAVGGTTISVKDEGTPLSGAVTTLDFAGAGVTATETGGVVTVTVPGAGAADILDLPTAEMDDTLVLAPDGAGGVEFRAETGGGAGVWPPDVPPGTPNAEDDEFDGVSLDAKWTHTGAGTLTFGTSRMTIQHAASSTDEKVHQPYTPGAGVAFMITAKFTGFTLIQNIDYLGLEVYDSGGTAIAACDLRSTGSNQLSFNRDNPGGGSTIGIPPIFGSTVYLRIARDASNVYTFSLSPDGVAYSTCGMGTGTSSTTVARVGIRFGQTASVGYKYASVDWFRRM